MKNTKKKIGPMNLIEPNTPDHSEAEAVESVSSDANGNNVFETLCQITRDGMDIHRCIAARALGRIGDDAASETLIAALLDEDEDVRADAAAGLVLISDPAAEKQLLENFIGDPCRDVKLSAIDALAKIGSTEVVPLLRRVVRSRDTEIVWDDDDYYASGWDDWTDIQVKAIRALGEIGDTEAAPDVVAAIVEEDGQDLDHVGFKALSKMGDEGLQALSDFLESNNARRRRRAASMLISTDTPYAEAALMKAFEDEAPAVRLAAGEALAKRNPADERLVFILLDKSPEVRAEAVNLCASHHPDRLLRLISDPATPVRIAALNQLANNPELGAGDHAELIAEISATLYEQNDELCAAALSAYAALEGEAALETLTTTLENKARPAAVRLAAVAGLAKLGGDVAAKALANELGDENRQLRLDALAGLSSMASREGAWPNAYGQMLLAALSGELVPNPEPEAEPEAELQDDETPEPETSGEDGEGEASDEDVEVEEEPRPTPTSTLDAILNPDNMADVAQTDEEANIELNAEDLDFLALTEQRKLSRKTVALVPDVEPHKDVRAFAARLLGDHANGEVAELLAGVLEEEDEALLLAAADSLIRVVGKLDQVSETVRDAAIDLISKPQPELRLFAVRALSAMDADEVIEKALARLLKDEDSFLRVEAVTALGRLHLMWPAIVKRLSDEDPSVRMAAATALVGRASSEDIDLIGDFSLSFEGYHGREAARLMRKFNAIGGNEYFLNVLADEEQKRYWQVAIEALEEINQQNAA